MPFCKACGTFYTKSLGICPKCNAEELLKDMAAPEPYAQNEKKGVLLWRWVSICVGIPALIGFIYILLSLLKKLQT